MFVISDKIDLGYTIYLNSKTTINNNSINEKGQTKHLKHYKYGICFNIIIFSKCFISKYNMI